MSKQISEFGTLIPNMNIILFHTTYRAKFGQSKMVGMVRQTHYIAQTFSVTTVRVDFLLRQ